MLYHNDGVTRVAEFLQGVDEAEVVPLMKTDARLIEDIEHIHELRTYLGSQSDALAFSTRQRYGCAVERKIIQAYIEQEAESALEFLQDFSSNFLLLAFEVRLHILQPVIKLVDVHARQFVDVLVVDAEVQGFAVEAGPLTFGTHICLGKLVGPLLGGGRGFLLLHHLDVFHDTFVGGEIIGGGMDEAALDFDALVRAVKHVLNGFFGEVLQRSLQGQFVFLQQGFQLPENHHVLVLAKRGNPPFVDG